MSTWTTSDLLTSIKTRAMLPDASSGSLGTATLLNFASDELLITLVPMITSVRANYFETFSDTTVTSSLTKIAVPSRAIGSVLSSVLYIRSQDVRQMLPIDPSTVTTTQTSAYPTNYYFQNNDIVPYPLPGSIDGTIRLRYFQRPSRLEQTINCAQITAYDATTVTCSAIPSTWAIGNTVDFIPKNQNRSTPYGIDTAITNVSSTVITFAATPVDSSGTSLVTVGDWVALSEYTPIPEVPFEFQAILAQAAACKALEAIKDQAGLANAKEVLNGYMTAALKLMTPRDQNGPRKIVSNWRRF